MPHVDEGTLHALLDGALRAMEPGRADAVEAHLESCAECRALAEEAAALRGRAGEVLGVLEPGVAPDFEEVLVRAGATGGPPRRHPLARQARWTRGLAWAATIVIALGTGYLIRDRLVPERAASFGVEAPVTRDPAAEAGQASTAAPQAETRASTETTPLESARSGAGAATSPGGEADAAVMEGAEAAAMDAASAAGAPATGAPAGAVETRAPAGRPVSERRAAIAPAPPPPAPAVEGARPETGAARTGAREALPPSEPAAAMADALEGEPIALQGIVVTGAVSAPGSRVITPEEAAGVLDAPFLVLPRAEVTLVTVEPGEGGPVVVSLQRLGEGVVIRVTQSPQRDPAPLGQAADPRVMSAAPAPGRQMKVAAEEATGSNTARVRVSGAELVLEGALPADVLELLGGAAEPYARPR